MNKDLIANQTVSALSNDQPGFVDKTCRKIVMRLLERFSKGRLEITFPDGERRLYGNPECADKPAQLYIHHPSFYRNIVLHGEIGFGESYVGGGWSTPDLPRVIESLIANLEAIPGMSGSKASALAINLLQVVNRFNHFLRRNTVRNSKRNIAAHYDLSNDFYSLWLDQTWTYSSAWFKQDTDSLESAQSEKYDRLCQRLQLAPGMQILEIGCGWGGFAIHAARHYNVSVTAITISKEQFSKATQRIAEAGLEDKISVQLIDYRAVHGAYDAIVSIEMLEAVGHEFLPAFFKQCHRLLKPDGRLGLQVIVCPDARYDSMRRSTDWIKKHIFPGGQLPSIKALIDAIHDTGDLYLHHLESFGLHYARTLRLWRERFNDRIEDVCALGFDEPFVRKWNYYLAYCEAAFTSRNINVSQFVFSRPNSKGYTLELKA